MQAGVCRDSQICPICKFDMFHWLNSKPAVKKTLGQLGEEWAQGEYKKMGFKILAANVFNRKGKRAGEIDFIAKTSEVLAFVEVKTRTSGIDVFGRGAEAVNLFKQRKLLKAVKLFLARNQRYRHLRPQIDVCLVEVADLDKKLYSATIIPNAVEDYT